MWRKLISNQQKIGDVETCYSCPYVIYDKVYSGDLVIAWCICRCLQDERV